MPVQLSCHLYRTIRTWYTWYTLVAWATSYLRKLRSVLLSSQGQNGDPPKKAEELCPVKQLQVGDLVLIKSHLLSNAEKQLTVKLAPRRDGPYQIQKVVSPTTYQLRFPGSPDTRPDSPDQKTWSPSEEIF
jgi:hypothetical protein